MDVRVVSKDNRWTSEAAVKMCDTEVLYHSTWLRAQLLHTWASSSDGPGPGTLSSQPETQCPCAGLAWPGSCYGEHLDSESLCLSLSAFQINLQNLKISQQSHIIVLRVCFCGIVKTRIMVCHKLWWMCGQLPSEATASASWLTQNCWTSHFCRSGGWDIVIHWSLACHFSLSAKMDMFSDGSTSVFYKLNVHILMISLLSFSYDLHKSFFH